MSAARFVCCCLRAWNYGVWCAFVFFQAEDGIRDLVRSRGLGDVYKRQADGLVLVGVDEGVGVLVGRVADVAGVAVAKGVEPVSYTHLTLPTSDPV